MLAEFSIAGRAVAGEGDRSRHRPVHRPRSRRCRGHVLACSRTESELHSLAAEIDAGGGPCDTFLCDITAPGAIARFCLGRGRPGRPTRRNRQPARVSVAPQPSKPRTTSHEQLRSTSPLRTGDVSRLIAK